jgi:hypothetical protein
MKMPRAVYCAGPADVEGLVLLSDATEISCRDAGRPPVEMLRAERDRGNSHFF